MSNLDLIDWPLVGFSALWILGLGLILASLSFADYEAGQARLSLKQILGRKNYQVILNVGGTLFALGMTHGSQSWWEGALWLGLAILFGYQVWQSVYAPGKLDTK